LNRKKRTPSILLTRGGKVEGKRGSKIFLSQKRGEVQSNFRTAAGAEERKKKKAGRANVLSRTKKKGTASPVPGYWKKRNSRKRGGGPASTYVRQKEVRGERAGHPVWKDGRIGKGRKKLFHFLPGIKKKESATRYCLLDPNQGDRRKRKKKKKRIGGRTRRPQVRAAR